MTVLLILVSITAATAFSAAMVLIIAAVAGWLLYHG